MRSEKKTYTSEDIGMMMLNTILYFGGLLYRTLLVYLVWQWYVADKLFDLSYWGTLLTILIVGFIKGGVLNELVLMKKLDKISDKKITLTAMESVTSRLSAMVINTIMFGILWLVYVIIT